jgi:Carboxypeptidase regulatory-like domain
MRMKRALLALLVCLVAALMASAQDQGMGTLAGTVLNAQGKPTVGASVTMESSTGENPHATTTNAQGRFFFPELTHGCYDVRATHEGATSDWNHNVEVRTGKQTEITLRLPARRRMPQ